MFSTTAVVKKGTKWFECDNGDDEPREVTPKYATETIDLSNSQQAYLMFFRLYHGGANSAAKST